MASNLPQPSNDQPRLGDDLASLQRERILGSGQTPNEKLHGAPNSANLDAISRQILTKRGFNTAPFPNTDQLVILFLKEYDVDAMPPAGTASGDALSGAFFGAMGTAASFAGSHLRQQEKIAAMQEWTSWKQWAIGHADWPAFKEKIKKDYEANQALIHDALNSRSFKAEYDEYKVRRKKDNERTNKIVVLGIVLFTIASAIIIAVEKANDKPLNPYPDNTSPGFNNKQ
jgi:hypothetical protein